MCIYITYAPTMQSVLCNKSKHLFICSDVCLWQVIECLQNHLPVLQTSQRELTKHKWVDNNLTRI